MGVIESLPYPFNRKKYHKSVINEATWGVKKKTVMFGLKIIEKWTKKPLYVDQI